MAARKAWAQAKEEGSASMRRCCSTPASGWLGTFYQAAGGCAVVGKPKPEHQ
jgi:hypothetical protein